MQALPAAPESLCIIEMGGGGDRAFSVGGLFLNIGLQNGVLLRTALDSVTGDLSDTRTRQVTPHSQSRVNSKGLDPCPPI